MSVREPVGKRSAALRGERTGGVGGIELAGGVSGRRRAMKRQEMRGMAAAVPRVLQWQLKMPRRHVFLALFRVL